MKNLSLILLFTIISLAFSSVPFGKQKTFGTSQKNAHIPANVEYTTFEHNCTQSPCQVTLIHIPSVSEQWDTEFHVYIDDETTPSINMTVIQLAFEAVAANDGSPWGIGLFGKTSKGGGIYSEVKIPFQKNIRTAFFNAKGVQTYWYIIRGLEAQPTIIGDIQLPDNAKLKVHNLANFETQPLDFVPLVNVSSGTSGVLMAVNYFVQSKDLNYLEACMRAYIDGAEDPIFLSSGTEDYFLSAFYFDEGEFQTPNSGLTQKNGGTISAYKTHDTDPIIFNDGFVLLIRNFENTKGCGSTDLCPSEWCVDKNQQEDFEDFEDNFKVSTAPATFTTQTWVYEWPQNTQVDEGALINSVELVSELKKMGSMSEEEQNKIVDLLFNRFQTLNGQDNFISNLKTFLKKNEEFVNDKFNL